MSLVTIVIQDQEDGSVEIKTFFEPALNLEDDSPLEPAQRLALVGVFAIDETIQELGGTKTKAEVG